MGCNASLQAELNASTTHPRMGGAGLMPGGPRVVEDIICSHQIVVFTKTRCPYCARVLGALDATLARGRQAVTVVAVDEEPWSGVATLKRELQDLSGSCTVPQVFIGAEAIGGCDRTEEALASGHLQRKLRAAGVRVRQGRGRVRAPA